MRYCSILSITSLLAAIGAADAASLSVNPPPGHKVSQMPPTGSYTEAYEVPSTLDEDAGCQIAFQKTNAAGLVTQAQLNAIAAKPEYAQTVKAFIGLQAEVSAIEPFRHGDVYGVAVTGEPKGAPVRILFIILETPRGRTNISCAGPSAGFAKLRPEFEAIARGVVLPR